MIIDTHCHLDFEHFHPDRASVIKRAEEAGVKYIINVGSSPDGSRRSVELSEKYDNVFAAVGVHPHDAGEVTEEIFSEITELAKYDKVVAIGEVGLDYFKSSVSRERQKEIFVKFMELSRKLELPLVIHDREAHRDTLDILKKTKGSGLRGVMHCFSGDEKILQEVLEMGLFVSFTCNLTFKNARHLREVARMVPPQRLLLETDAPFLAPQAHRGERNEPAYIVELVDILSELLNLSKEEIENITTDNAKKLFGIPKD